MKYHFLSKILLRSAFALGLALGVSGCGKSDQQQAYEHAAQGELQLTAENSATLIAEYKRVIAREPGSEWARKAQARIEALEAKTKAEELHKSVFQEHGVD